MNKNSVKMFTVIQLYEGSKPELWWSETMVSNELNIEMSEMSLLQLIFPMLESLLEYRLWTFVIYVHFVVDCSPNIVIT